MQSCDVKRQDCPTSGSEQALQVAFWTRYARAASRRLRIETFAGYDPLRHAIEMRRNERRYFADLAAWAVAPPDADRRVAGFKLYPPMGFRVWKNEPLPSPNPGRAAENVRKLWTEDHGWPLEALPGALDAALDELFLFTTRHDIPLLAHGRDSNGAYPGASENAHPVYWLKRARELPPTAGRSPLRACIAHYRDEFDMLNHVQEILDLNLSGGANIFFDVAFEEEVIEQPGGADALLRQLERLCADREGAENYFLFGTDWIMLGQLPGYDRYVGAVDEAIGRSKFWKDKRAKLLGDNLRSFLKLGGSVREADPL